MTLRDTSNSPEIPALCVPWGPCSLCSCQSGGNAPRSSPEVQVCFIGGSLLSSCGHLSYCCSSKKMTKFKYLQKNLIIALNAKLWRMFTQSHERYTGFERLGFPRVNHLAAPPQTIKCYGTWYGTVIDEKCTSIYYTHHLEHTNTTSIAITTITITTVAIIIITTIISSSITTDISASSHHHHPHLSIPPSPALLPPSY